MSSLMLEFPSTHPSLLFRLKQFDRNAWELFFHRYQDVVYNWCRTKGLSDSDAEELSQQLMANAPCKVQTYQIWNGFGIPNRFRTWLNTVVHHTVVDHWKVTKEKTANYAPGDDLGRAEIDTQFIAEACREVGEELCQAMEQEVDAVVELAKSIVKPKTWEAYYQTAICDKPIDDVTQELDMTKTAIYAARSRVNKLLQELGAQHQENQLSPTGVSDHDSQMPRREYAA